MSVIIRLQNLPWSANALDIRQFFQGLSIPDGGVHIVGGEMGDAFIAFSTDEDARQAMLMDRGKLKEVQIRLLLSSRAEMQKVIETARQQSLAMMQAAVQKQQPQPPIISKLQQIPQPPVITSTTLNKILYQPQPNAGLNENSSMSYQVYGNDNSMDSRDSKDVDRGGYRGRERERYSRSSRSRSKSRERRRSRSRDRNDRRRRDRSRSKSRERRDRRRGRGSDSVDRDYDRKDSYTGDRSSQKDRDKVGAEKSSNIASSTTGMGVVGTVGALGGIGIWTTSPTQPVFQTNLTKGYSTVTAGQITPNAFQTSQTMYNSQQKTQQQQQLQKQEQVRLQQQQTPIFSSNMQLSSTKSQEQSNQDNKPLYNYQSFFKSNNSGALTTGDNIIGASKSMAFQNPYTAASASGSNKSNDSKMGSNNFTGMFGKANDFNRDGSDGSASPAVRSSQSNNNKTGEINYDEIVGFSIKICNMDPSTTYSELRRFFSGLYIANNGIKMINDQSGIRIGVAYVRFIKKESKPKAFARNGANLKGNKITIESITEDEFDAAIDSFKPSRRFGNRFDDEPRKDFTFGGRNNDDPPPYRRNGDSNDSEQPPFNNLILEEVPVFAKEQDIMKMFSSYTLTDIVLTDDSSNRKQLICYVKFHRAEDAKKALEESGTHVIGHKKVYVSPCTNDRFDRAKEKYGMQGIEEPPEEEKGWDSDTQDKTLEIIDYDNEETANINKPTVNEDAINDFTLEESTMDDAKKEIISNESNSNTEMPNIFNTNSLPPTTTEGPTDPRKRSRQGSRFSRPEDNQNNTNYALIKNCDFKSTKQHFVQFFARAGIPPVRVEICLNPRNQPSGECICEFSSSADAERALFQSNYYLGNRCVRIELISPEEVAKRLGDDFIERRPNDEDSNINTDNSPGDMGNISDMNSPMGMPGMGNMGSMNMNQMSPNMMMNNPGMGMNNFNSNMMNFRQNPFSGNNLGGGNGGGGDGFNEKFDNNFRNFSPPQHENPFRSGPNNNMSPGGNNMSGGLNNERYNNNRNNRGSRNGRQSRFTDFDDKGGNSNSMNNMNIGSKMNDMGGNMGMQTSMPPDTLGDTSVDQFGQPGCVVGMENVPYKATIEDIMEFFKMFNIQPHNVIRRYNDDGSPTGDARVAFSSPMQARAALDTKRHQKILNRTIFLSIV